MQRCILPDPIWPYSTRLTRRKEVDNAHQDENPFKLASWHTGLIVLHQFILKQSEGGEDGIESGGRGKQEGKKGLVINLFTVNLMDEMNYNQVR